MMKNKKLNATQIWKQFEDIVVPRLRLNIVDRAVYSHLLRHSRLEGKVRLQFSIPWLARAARLTSNPVRHSVRRLVEHGALRLVERSKVGHPPIGLCRSNFGSARCSCCRDGSN